MKPVPPQPQRTVPVRNWRVAGVGLLLATSLAVAACGGGDNGSDSSTSSAPSSPPAASSPSSPTPASSPSGLSLSAKGDTLAFNASKLTAGAGKVTINFTNGSSLDHNVTLADS